MPETKFTIKMIRSRSLIGENLASISKSDNHFIKPLPFLARLTSLLGGVSFPRSARLLNLV